VGEAQRTLEDDDRAGICFLYPEAVSTLDAGPSSDSGMTMTISDAGPSHDAGIDETDTMARPEAGMAIVPDARPGGSGTELERDPTRARDVAPRDGPAAAPGAGRNGGCAVAAYAREDLFGAAAIITWLLLFGWGARRRSAGPDVTHARRIQPRRPPGQVSARRGYGRAGRGLCGRFARLALVRLRHGRGDGDGREPRGSTLAAQLEPAP
jgi:hypothetical protein